MTPEASSNNAAPPLGEVGRIADVFIDPKKAFADIAARPGWIVPIVLVVVAYLAFMYCFTTHVGWEHSMRQAMETNSRVQQMDPQQREAAGRSRPRHAWDGTRLPGVSSGLERATRTWPGGRRGGAARRRRKPLDIS